LVLSSDFLVLVSQGGVLSSPSVDLGLGAGAWLFVDSDDLSSSGASDDSVSENEFLSLGLDEPSSDLDSSESGSDLLATARLSLDDDLLGSLADSSSVVPDLVLSVDGLDLLSGLNSSDLVIVDSGLHEGGVPSLESLLSARARLLFDDDLSGLLANSESVSVDDDSVVNSVGSDLESDSVGSSSVDGEGVSPLFDLVESAWARLASDDNDLSSFGASGESVSDHSGVAVSLGDSDLCSPDSDLLLDILARAWLVFHNDDSLAGLGADLGSLAPDCESLLSVLSSLDSDLSKLDVVDSDSRAPLSDVVLGARAWLVSDDDQLASLLASDQSTLHDVLFSDELLSPDLNSDGIDLSLSDLNRDSVGVRDSVKSDLVSVDLC
jgi:hypothetical protein